MSSSATGKHVAAIRRRAATARLARSSRYSAATSRPDSSHIATALANRPAARGCVSAHSVRGWLDIRSSSTSVAIESSDKSAAAQRRSTHSPSKRVRRRTHVRPAGRWPSTECIRRRRTRRRSSRRAVEAACRDPQLDVGIGPATRAARERLLTSRRRGRSEACPAVAPRSRNRPAGDYRGRPG